MLFVTFMIEKKTNIKVPEYLLIAGLYVDIAIIGWIVG